MQNNNEKLKDINYDSSLQNKSLSIEQSVVVFDKQIDSLKELYNEKIDSVKIRLDNLENGELRRQDKSFNLKLVLISVLLTIIGTLLIEHLLKLFIN